MASIGEIGATAHIGSAIRSRREIIAAGPVPPQRALVPLTPRQPIEPETHRPGLARAQAGAAFLTHLIAAEQGIAQTRRRRRADPKWVAATYAAAMRAPDAGLPAVSAIRWE